MSFKYYSVLIIGLCVSAIVYAQGSITEKEAVSTGKTLEKQVSEGHAAEMLLLIDSASFYGKIVAQDPEVRTPRFMQGFHETFTLTKLAPQIDAVVKKGSFRFVHAHQKGGQYHLLFRLMPGLGVNYYDFPLIKVNGAIKASDGFIYVLGEDISVMLGNLIQSILANAKSTNDLKGLAATLSKLKGYKDKGDWQGLKTAYDALDEDLRHNKEMELHNLLACQHLSPAVYQEALEQYIHDCPDGTNGYIMMIDAYTLSKQYDKALRAIDKLDSLTGGDPALDYFRANQYEYLGKADSVFQCHQRVFAYDPSLPNNMAKLAKDYVKMGELEKAKAVVDTFKKTALANVSYLENLYAEVPELK